jgi:hypothetical protein
MIYALTGSLALARDSGRNAGLPFAAPLRALAHNARFAWALPALGAWMVPVAAGVVRRGPTIPSVLRAERLLRVPV